MKARMLFLISFLFLNLTTILFAQADFSKPELVAEKFLELYFKGNWFDACNIYGVPKCEDQLSFMIKKMMTDDDYIEEGTCTFKIDTCIVNKDKNEAQCFYTKTCSAINKAKKNHLDLKLLDNKWLVDYTFRKNKYL